MAGGLRLESSTMPPSKKAAGESASAPGNDTGFDARLERLESLVSELESGELGLEPAIERYQAGVELLKSCRDLLQQHQRRVEELSADAEAALQPFEGDPDAS